MEPEENIEFGLVLSRSPSKWFSAATNLYQSSALLAGAIARAHRVRRVERAKFVVPNLSDPNVGLHAQAEMLRAMAFECELKGYLCQKYLDEHGHVSKVPDVPLSHDLNKLVEELGIVADEDMKTNLRWQTSMIQMGRYPVARRKEDGKVKLQSNHVCSPSLAHFVYQQVRDCLPSGVAHAACVKFSKKYVRAIRVRQAEHRIWQEEMRRQHPEHFRMIDEWRRQRQELAC